MKIQSVPQPTLYRARRGDPDAFEVIVRSYDGNLRVMTHRVLGAAWTEDVLQETYIRAFRALPNFAPDRGSLGAWLHRIAYRACLDEIQRSKRRGFTADSTEEAVESGPSPTEQLMDRLSLWRALAALTPEERAAVVLVDALGFPYEEAAAILEIPRGTVASRLNRGRTVIRDALRDDEEDQDDEQTRAKG